MATHRRERFIHATVGWMLGVVFILGLLGSLTYELFFVLSLIGFLIITDLTAPINVTPVWRSRLRWLVGAGLVIFGYIVIRRILAILPQGVLDALIVVQSW